MLYESVLVRFTLILLQKLKTAYYDSASLAVLNRMGRWVQELFSESWIFSFIGVRDALADAAPYSRGIGILNGLVSVPMRIIRKLYTRHESLLEGSLLFSLTKAIVRRMEIVLGLVLVLIMIVPHQRWYNGYSTILVLMLGLLYFIKKAVAREEEFNFSRVDIALLVFMLIVALTEVTSAFPHEGLSFFIFIVTCFMLTLIIIGTVKTREQLGTLLDIILVGVAFTGLYGIWQGVVVGVQVDPSLTDVNLNQGMPGRVFSTMGNPNNYAEMLVLTLPFFFAAVLNAKSLLKKGFFILLMVPLFASLALTLSRSAWIAFAIGLFVFLFFKDRRLIPAVILLGIAGIPLLPEWVYRRILTIWNPNDSSINYRTLIYKTVAPMFQKYWLTGVGLGSESFMKVCQNYALYTTLTPPHTHNLFLQVWIENGILGILVFLWVIFRMVKNSVLRIFSKTDEYINNILMAGLASTAGILVMGLAEYIWFYPRVMLVFWMVIGIILAALGVSSRKNIITGKSCR